MTIYQLFITKNSDGNIYKDNYGVYTSYKEAENAAVTYLKDIHKSLKAKSEIVKL